MATLGVAVAVALLVAGCARSVPGYDIAIPGGTPPSTPAGRQAEPCPTPAQWQGLPAPTAVGGTPVNTPEAEELSQAVGAQGRLAAFADSYGTQITDFPAGRVALCVTDLAAGHRLATAAKRADPKADLARLDYYLCRYPVAELDQAARRLTPLLPNGLLGFPFYRLGPAPDASGLLVDSTAAGAKSAALRAELQRRVGAVAVTVEAGSPAMPAVGAVATGK